MTDLSRVKLSVKVWIFPLLSPEGTASAPTPWERFEGNAFCLRYVKNEGLVQMSVFLFALCVDLFKTQVCVNAEEKHRTELHGLSRSSSQLSTKKFKCSFCFWDEAQRLWEYPAGHPTLSCPCRTWHPLPSVVTEPQSQQRQKPGPEGSTQHYFRKKMFPWAMRERNHLVAI